MQWGRVQKRGARGWRTDRKRGGGSVKSIGSSVCGQTAKIPTMQI